MKKLILITCLACVATSLAFAKKPRLTIKNTVGADFDQLGDYDFFTHTEEKDINDENQSDNLFAFGDQLQADYESDLFDARLRLDMLYHSADDGVPTMLFAPSGFVHFTPMPQFGVIFGNNFYKRFAIKSAYLAAADDVTKYGRLITDSLGHEEFIGSDDVSLFLNGIAGGVTSDWAFGENSAVYLKAAFGATVWPDGSDTEYALDFGLNAGVLNAVDFGFTAHNVNDDARKFGVFAGLNAVQNLILNTAFYYNFTSSDYLPELGVERGGYLEYKKQTTKYALGLSGGYNFVDRGIAVYADLITGLSNEYIGKIKYYDSDGNLTDTEVTTIVRGQTIVKYKNATAKRTDEFTHEAIPFYSQFRITYQASDTVETAFNFKLRTLINDSDSTWLTFYPRCSVKLPQKAGTVDAGVRLDMNLTSADGVSAVSVPVTYTYKFKKKFK